MSAEKERLAISRIVVGPTELVEVMTCNICLTLVKASDHEDHVAAMHSGQGAMDAFCSTCNSLMVEDDGAGYLCPACDAHPSTACGQAFPCSGLDGSPCALNAPIGSRITSFGADV